MKYTIPAIDQRAALALGDIDLIDCHLLQWLFYFCNSKNESIERTREGVWVSYQHLTKEMPLLGIKRHAIGKRMADLAAKKYIQLTTNQGKRKTYIKLLSKVEWLFGDTANNREPGDLRHPATSQEIYVTRPDHQNHLARRSTSPDQYHKEPIYKDQDKNPELAQVSSKASEPSESPSDGRNHSDEPTGYLKAKAIAERLRMRPRAISQPVTATSLIKSTVDVEQAGLAFG